MNDVLKGVIGKFVIIYLDDIVVYSKDQAEHYRHLQIVLQLLREHELYANLSYTSSATLWVPKGFV